MKYFLIIFMLSFSVLADTPTGGTGGAVNDYGAGGESVYDPETGITTHSDGSVTYPDGNTYDRNGTLVSSSDPNSAVNHEEIPPGEITSGRHYKIVAKAFSGRFTSGAFAGLEFVYPGEVHVINYSNRYFNVYTLRNSNIAHSSSSSFNVKLKTSSGFSSIDSDWNSQVLQNGVFYDLNIKYPYVITSGSAEIVYHWREFDENFNNPFNGDASDTMPGEDEAGEDDEEDEEDEEDEDQDGDGIDEDFENNIGPLEDLLDRFDIPTITASERDPTIMTLDFGNHTYHYDGVSSNPTIAAGLSVVKSILELVLTVFFILAVLRQFKT